MAPGQFHSTKLILLCSKYFISLSLDEPCLFNAVSLIAMMDDGIPLFLFLSPSHTVFGEDHIALFFVLGIDVINLTNIIAVIIIIYLLLLLV